MKTTRKQILAANLDGVNNQDSLGGYVTGVLQVAFELGQRGIDLSGQPDVSGYRYGSIPESGISYNYRDHTSERGLSLAAIDGAKEIGSCMWFADRNQVRVTGMLLPYTGSDGESLVLAYGLDIID